MWQGNNSPNRPRKRTRGQRPQTISISLPERGQTTQDFAVGIGLFLLSIAFVFSYLPSLTTSVDSSIGGAETAQTDRIADRLVYNLSTSTGANEIDGEQFVSTYVNDTDNKNLTALGLRANGDEDVVFDHVSVRLETLNGTVVTRDDGTDLVAGTATYDNQSAASTARVVTLDEGFTLNNHDDEPAYRLVVRLW